MKLPSVKTLEAAFPGKGRALRRLLQDASAVNEHPAALARIAECYHPPGMADKRMAALNAELEGHGVEFVPRGNNARSPAFDYVNMGDTYTTTICRTEAGRYLVCCMGDIIEKGDYP